MWMGVSVTVTNQLVLVSLGLHKLHNRLFTCLQNLFESVVQPLKLKKNNNIILKLNINNSRALNIEFLHC